MAVIITIFGITTHVIIAFSITTLSIAKLGISENNNAEYSFY
jgi:hypothetical protein